jgi:hypothetical protein
MEAALGRGRIVAGYQREQGHRWTFKGRDMRLAPHDTLPHERVIPVPAEEADALAHLVLVKVETTKRLPRMRRPQHWFTRGKAKKQEPVEEKGESLYLQATTIASLGAEIVARIGGQPRQSAADVRSGAGQRQARSRHKILIVLSFPTGSAQWRPVAFPMAGDSSATTPQRDGDLKRLCFIAEPDTRPRLPLRHASSHALRDAAARSRWSSRRPGAAEFG